MMKRPPPKDVPTFDQNESELDGANRSQLDDTQRLRVAVASESHTGTIAFDDRGAARWKWNTELGLGSADSDATFNELKALDNPHLRVEQASAPKPDRPSKTGYDPYATGSAPRPKRPKP